MPVWDFQFAFQADGTADDRPLVQGEGQDRGPLQPEKAREFVRKARIPSALGPELGHLVGGHARLDGLDRGDRILFACLDIGVSRCEGVDMAMFERAVVQVGFPDSFWQDVPKNAWSPGRTAGR